ncbi:MAG: AAA family ATPase [Candidatus Pacebacteria bacterium]|nr:AAA family ATPase [Candidatus Paceibacterota bacterium]
MKITIFGNPGTGKSTVGKLLASKLGYAFMSSGNMFRDMAKELGMTVYELDTLSQTDPQYDIKLDQMVAEYGRTNDNFVFESRLAWHFIPDSIKIELYTNDVVAAERVAQRDQISTEDARANNELRIATYVARYPKTYPDVHYPPLKEDFHLSIDVTEPLPEAIVERILTFLKKEGYVLE